MTEPGLYIVSTPIGNLKDITLRALDILKEADLIACEDTRHTNVLLRHYGIEKRLVSFHDYNKTEQTPYLIGLLKEGKAIALVSDAGTPGISDPGYYLVREALKKGINVVPIPGASALLAALVVAGLPTDHFVFEGYLPKRPGRRIKRLKELSEERRTIVIYESPMRIKKLLFEMVAMFGDREIVLARELTKQFESFTRGRLDEIVEARDTLKTKGEYVVIVRGRDDR
jgi:16S rRNA (cytidine1402-2'-O)-methyltransferase